MNTCNICDRTALNGPKPHSIRMPRMVFDQKLAYVESVCDVLLESRFGPGYSYSYIDRPPHNAADEPSTFLDLMEHGSMPWYAEADRGLNSLRVRGKLGVRKNLHAKTAGSSKKHKGEFQGLNLAALISNHSTSSLARGSPPFHGRTSSFASRLRS